ncbi:hypothetical protein [Burkholderia sp. Ac-20365]|uniref:hypothetical protein n=1 Tax=Burkholderia sp. Ac-20365 TaxID=2703897 RepID=UPI00197C4365|nr:hypothetical protein [Burkholderia sp. Ac-20365]MBN3763404.1 hypothetical protein [Burkholderia sp. Ac-20365]
MNRYKQNAQLIDLIERAGMRQELEDRVEAQKLEKRKELVTERGRLLRECEEVMPQLDAAAVEARETVALLEQKLFAAHQAMHSTLQRAYGTRCSYGTGVVDAEIERNAPQFMQDAFDALQEAIDFLRGTVCFWQQPQRVGWGFQTIDVSNCEQVGTLRRKCQDGQDEIRAMMFDVGTPTDAQRARCAAILEQCVALTHPQLKDDRHWLMHQERKARATKSA